MNTILTELKAIDWAEVGKHALQNPYFWPSIIGIFLIFYIWRAIRKKQAFIQLFSAPAGSVKVSQNALVDLIKKNVTDITSGSNPKVCIYQKSGKLNVKIKLVLQSGQNIETLSSKIQCSLFSTLKEHLGLENIGKINILVSGFKPSSKHPSPEIEEE